MNTKSKRKPFKSTTDTRSSCLYCGTVVSMSVRPTQRCVCLICSKRHSGKMSDAEWLTKYQYRMTLPKFDADVRRGLHIEEAENVVRRRFFKETCITPDDDDDEI